MEIKKARFEKDDFGIDLFEDERADNIITAIFRLKRNSERNREQLFDEIEKDLQDLGKWRKFKELKKDLEEQK